MTEPNRTAASEPARSGRASLDPLSRLHVRSFVTCVLILVTFNLPVLLATSFQPGPALSRMKLIFGMVAWVASILAAQRKQRLFSPSLTLWDEAAGFLALALACSAGLGMIG